MNRDGSNVRQLTDSKWEDSMGTYVRARQGQPGESMSGSASRAALDAAPGARASGQCRLRGRARGTAGGPAPQPLHRGAAALRRGAFGTPRPRTSAANCRRLSPNVLRVPAARGAGAEQFLRVELRHRRRSASACWPSTRAAGRSTRAISCARPGRWASPFDRVVITHEHPDHIVGLTQFPPGIEIVAQEETRAQMVKMGTPSTPAYWKTNPAWGHADDVNRVDPADGHLP